MLGNAGGSLAIAADAVLTADLELADLAAVDARRGRRPARRRTPSPGTVDLGPHAGAHDVERATAALVADPGVDAVLVLHAEGLGATTDEAVAAVAHRAQGPAARCRWSCAPTGLSRTRSAEVPVFDAVDAAADALGRVAAYAAVARPSRKARCSRSTTSRPRRPASSCRSSSTPGRAELGDVDALALLDAIGLRILRTEVADATWTKRRRPPRRSGYPVVLKAAGRAPTAKTAAAGFAIDLEGPDALEDRVGADGRRPRRRPHPGARAADGRPGCRRGRRACATTPRSGPSCRSGWAVRRPPSTDPPTSACCPLTDLDAARLVAGSRLASALDDADRAALEAALLRVAALIEEVPEVGELTINPLIVRDGAAVVTQARATIGAIERDPLPPVRRA